MPMGISYLRAAAVSGTRMLTDSLRNSVSSAFELWVVARSKIALKLPADFASRILGAVHVDVQLARFVALILRFSQLRPSAVRMCCRRF
jgi:hypothetical protein